MSSGNTDQKSAAMFPFLNHKTFTYVHFTPNDCFVYAKWQIKLEVFFSLFALNYLQIIICKLFANKNYLQINLPSTYIGTHSSEIRGLCLMKCSSEMLQNLPYLWNTKTHVDFFFVFHFVLLFFPNECPMSTTQHRQGRWLGEKCSPKWKTKIKLYGFSYSKIMAIFEAFR